MITWDQIYKHARGERWLPGPVVDEKDKHVHFFGVILGEDIAFCVQLWLEENDEGGLPDRMGDLVIGYFMKEEFGDGAVPVEGKHVTFPLLALDITTPMLAEVFRNITKFTGAMLDAETYLDELENGPYDDDEEWEAMTQEEKDAYNISVVSKWVQMGDSEIPEERASAIAKIIIPRIQKAMEEAEASGKGSVHRNEKVDPGGGG